MLQTMLKTYDFVRLEFKHCRRWCKHKI